MAKRKTIPRRPRTSGTTCRRWKAPRAPRRRRSSTGTSSGGRRAARPSSPYVELHTASAFSFLNGASLPEDLIQQAAELGLPAVALVDANGVYGAPRFYQAAKQAGVRALVGAEVVLDEGPGSRARSARTGPLGLVPEPAPEKKVLGIPTGERLTLLVENRAGYKNLCRMLTTAALGRPKGEARVTWDLLAEHAGGLHCLTGGDEGPVARELAPGRARCRAAQAPGAARRLLRRPGPRRAAAPPPARRGAPQPRPDRPRPQAAAPARRHQRRALRPARGQAAPRRAHRDPPSHHPGRGRRASSPATASGTSRSPRRDGPPLRRPARGDRRRPPSLADRLDFTLADLGYRFPEYPLPPGETPASYLRHITWNGAKARFRPLTAKAQAQIQKELDLIEKLDLAGYFLIVWDIVQLLPAREHPRPGPRLGGQQRGLLRPLDHRRRSGEDGAPLRALPLRRARRVAGHRPRPPLRRPAREGHPARLQDATASAARP